ncbi:OsmC family protein [Actinomadura terrae]|uniref:OsmC family protein n=1 Tax=Actinomadura terrae TaxID=604353 RepID=UPI001FA6CCC0|nr:OsmC family protein [Actinomadura terrae]
MSKSHHYEVSVTWTGNTGTGTSSYRAYERAHEVAAEGKAPIAGSADPGFRGDPARWNPEELLVASVSQCHMLWFLHLCATEKIVVTSYTDTPHGTMTETPDGGGRFEEVVLRPRVTLADPAKTDRVGELHERAHELCFIANSVNFPVRHEPVSE